MRGLSLCKPLLISLGDIGKFKGSETAACRKHESIIVFHLQKQLC